MGILQFLYHVGIYFSQLFPFLFSIIYDWLGKDGKSYQEATHAHLSDHTEDGLRTLAIAYRRLETCSIWKLDSNVYSGKDYNRSGRDKLLGVFIWNDRNRQHSARSCCYWRQVAERGLFLLALPLHIKRFYRLNPLCSYNLILFRFLIQDL